MNELVEDQWLTRDQVCERAGISPRTLDRWLGKGILTRYTDGAGRVSVSAAELADVLTPRPVPGAARTA